MSKAILLDQLGVYSIPNPAFGSWVQSWDSAYDISELRHYLVLEHSDGDLYLVHTPDNGVNWTATLMPSATFTPANYKSGSLIAGDGHVGLSNNTDFFVNVSGGTGAWTGLGIPSVSLGANLKGRYLISTNAQTLVSDELSLTSNFVVKDTLGSVTPLVMYEDNGTIYHLSTSRKRSSIDDGENWSDLGAISGSFSIDSRKNGKIAGGNGYAVQTTTDGRIRNLNSPADTGWSSTYMPTNVTQNQSLSVGFNPLDNHFYVMVNDTSANTFKMYRSPTPDVLASWAEDTRANVPQGGNCIIDEYIVGYS